MSMGLRNVPVTFETLMNQIFCDCIDVFVVVYIEDLLIFRKTPEKHPQHFEIVLSRLRNVDLYVLPREYCFMET